MLIDLVKKQTASSTQLQFKQLIKIQSDPLGLKLPNFLYVLLNKMCIFYQLESYDLKIKFPKNYLIMRSYIQDGNMLTDKVSLCQSNIFIFHKVLKVRKVNFFKGVIPILFVD